MSKYVCGCPKVIESVCEGLWMFAHVNHPFLFEKH